MVLNWKNGEIYHKYSFYLVALYYDANAGRNIIYYHKKSCFLQVLSEAATFLRRFA